MSIFIKCPTTGKVLSVDEEGDPEIAKATITCPACGQPHIVGACQRVIIKKKQKPKAAPEQTNYVDPFAQKRREKVVASDNTQVHAGALIDAAGKRYALKLGVNTIGRKSSQPKATVQILTDDRYMSRNNSIIEVRMVNGKAVHYLRNSENKNSTYLNGALVGQTDQFILNNGDTLRLGRTILTFKI